ncbi:MAG TPA: DUF481 domain-containing protein [Aquifex aeolicus]|nr:DUF481 domain-containing protein [Aquifex aeolicus]
MKKSLILIVLTSLPLFGVEGKPFSVRLELSYVNTSGNVETQTLSEKGEVEIKGIKNRLFMKNSFLYITRDGEESANRLEAEGRWEHLISERFFGFVMAGYLRDRFSGYEYRWNGGPGFGYDFLRGDKHELKVLLSYLYYYNRIEDGTLDNYPTLRAELRWKWSIYENLRLKKDLSYFVNLSDPQVYFINSETSLEVKIKGAFSLGVGYRLHYQNTPPEPGLERTDTTFSTSLILDL